MYFDDLNSFLSMGGYGLYVWLSFGVAGFGFAVLWLESLGAKRKLFKQVALEKARQARMKAAKNKPTQAGENI